MYYLIISIIMFILSIIGMIINKKNILIILICLELMLLSLSLNFLIIGFINKNLFGLFISLFIITIAAVESAIGLSIIISFYKIKGSISLRFINLLKG
uniref:NADH-ubiquinone oxidoreductase chain 4L n=1 Tax=Pennaria disticha TaxID=264068 RepID=G9ISZ7_9CNID|nr:NADH dehydrogenase subunit 4L [Pennaria disticha]